MLYIYGHYMWWYLKADLLNTNILYFISAKNLTVVHGTQLKESITTEFRSMDTCSNHP